MSAQAEPRSSFVDIGTCRLHYVVHGEPGKPALLLQHGMRDHARSWDWIASHFASDYFVVAPDLRGHGDSFQAAPTSYSMAAYVLDMADVVEALGLHDFALVGHSLGGAIVLRYASAFPEHVRSLCAIEAVELPIVRDERSRPVPHPTRLRSWVEAEQGRRDRAPRGYATLADAEHRMAEEHPRLDPATIAHLVKHGLAQASDGRWQWKYDNAARLRAPDDADGRDIDAMLSAITCPVLLAYGDASWIPLPPEDRLALIADHRIAHFAEASHWLHHEARQPFIDELSQFLEMTSKGPAHA